MATKTQGRTRRSTISRTQAPEGMSLADWQRALRRQFGPTQPFVLTNLTGEPVFSEFSVHNPESGRTYRVAVRGEAPGANYCSCPDYSVNTLGTCKHVEFVLSELRGRHRRALAAGYRPAESEVYVAYGARRTIRFAAGVECPRVVQDAGARLFGGDGDGLSDDASDKLSDLLALAARHNHRVRVYDDALAILAERRDARTRRERLARALGDRAGNAAWRRLLKVELFPYQRDGALFAASAGRALIADEMGLGKTIQAIAAAEILAKECGVERALVVCPTSLKSQWRAEIEKFCERSATIIDGGLARRAEHYAHDDAFFKIANYDVVHRDLGAIARWSPDLVILDEAQRIKNWQTRAARAVKQIASRFAIVLTGTPLENRLDELHSIVEFVDRHRLGPLFAFKAAHEVHEPESTKVTGYRDLGAVNRTLAPILIRRTKSEVLSQLPPRLDKNFFVPMTDPQWDHHHENREIVAKLVQKWRKFKFLSEADQLRLRIALQNMRMSCDNTYLLDRQTRHGTKVDEIERLLEEVFERPEQKVVVFSQWVRMNELVAEMLERRGWGHVNLHGGVPGARRGELVRRLREDDSCRVFLSSDAGGVGLNLQRAATVVNVDLPWNPAVLEQRIARVHRLGQKQPVRVVNFIAESTIEHGMLSLLRFKQSMFSGVLDGTADEVSMGGGALKRFMSTVDSATSGAPIVEPTPAEPDAATTAADAPLVAAESRVQETPGGLLVPARSVALAGETQGACGATLGELLARGAEFLATLSQSLNPPGDADPERSAARVHVDPANGRRELRIALPDERVLSQLAERMLTLLSGIAGGRAAS